METKRVLGEKKIFLLFFVLFLGNILFFYTQQMQKPELGDVHSYRERKQLCERYETEDGSLQLPDTMTKQESSAVETLWLHRSGEKEHCERYKEKLRAIEEDAKEMEEISIFSQVNSFADRNRQKTQRDFAKLADCKLEFGENQGVVSVVENYSWTICLFVFGVFLLQQIQLGENRGLAAIVRTTYRGRGWLRGRQLLLFIGLCLGAGAILFLSLVFAGNILYGWDVGWKRAVQSIPEFADVTSRWNIGTFLLLDFGYGVLGVLAGLCLLWALVCVLRSWQFGLLGIALLYGSGYLCTTWIEETSLGSVFRIWNIYHLLYPGENISEYHNYSVFSQAVGQTTCVGVFSLLCCVMGISICMLESVRTRHHLGFQRKKRSFPKLGRTIFGLECYQLLRTRKGIWILLIAVGVTRFLAVQAPVSYTTGQIAMNRIYDTYGGKISEDLLEKVQELKREEKKLLQQKENNLKKYQKEKISYGEFRSEQQFLEKDLEKVTIVHEIEEKVERLQTWEEKGSKVEFIPETGYEKIFHKSVKRRLETVLLVVVMLLLLHGFVKDLKQTGWRYHVRATMRGRRVYFWKRGMVLMSILFLTYVLVFAMDFYSIQVIYPMSHFNASIHSLAQMEQIRYDMPIWMYLLVYDMKRAGVYCLVGGFIYAIQYIMIMKGRKTHGAEHQSSHKTLSA